MLQWYAKTIRFARNGLVIANKKQTEKARCNQPSCLCSLQRKTLDLMSPSHNRPYVRVTSSNKSIGDASTTGNVGLHP
eukprot:4674524-Amphidinium_carterae.1